MKRIEIACADGWILAGHQFEATVGATADARKVPDSECRLPEAACRQQPGIHAPLHTDNPRGVVVIACATGVLSSYYHRYAKFLANHGFTAITFDYRGIGASAPQSLRNFKSRWYDWGYLDIDAVLAWARAQHPESVMHFVGHSFGGFGVGLAAHNKDLTRILSVGAQHAYWPDYTPKHKAGFLARWHVRMPLATLRRGYFDGKRRGWLEDLPAGVALDWARSRKDFTATAPAVVRDRLRGNQRAMNAGILAIAATDDPFATEAAMARALGYTPHAPRRIERISPQSLGCTEIGHFALFHARFAESFWVDTLRWLADGSNPWAPSGQVPSAQSSAAAGQPDASGSSNGAILRDSMSNDRLNGCPQ